MFRKIFNALGSIATDVWGAAARTLTAATNITSDGNTIDQTKIAAIDVIRDTTSRGGTTYFVSKTGNDGNSGTDSANARLTIVSILGLMNDGDSLIIGPGNYVENVNWGVDNGFTVYANIPDSNGGVILTGTHTTTGGGGHGHTFHNIYFTNTTGITFAESKNFSRFFRCIFASGGTGTQALKINPGDFNQFFDCYMLGGLNDTILINSNSNSNHFENCEIHPSQVAGAPAPALKNGILLDGGGVLGNTFINCLVRGGNAAGTGILIEGGALRNSINGCFVSDMQTANYTVPANNYMVGCQESSQISALNTNQQDSKDIYDIWNTSLPAYGDITDSSPFDELLYIDGYEVEKTLQLTPGGGLQQQTAFFVLTGVIKVVRIELFVTDDTQTVVFGGVSFIIDDGILPLPITGDVDMHGCIVGDLMIKEDINTNAGIYIDTSSAGISDPGADKFVSKDFIVWKNDGQVTNISLQYTGALLTNIGVEMKIHYIPISSDGLLVAV